MLGSKAGNASMVVYCAVRALVVLIYFWTDLPTSLAREGTEGSLRIACCLKSGEYTDPRTGKVWMSDDNHIDGSGRCVTLPMDNNFSVRIFPHGGRNCYTWSTVAGQQYLIRGTFQYGNYDGKLKPPVFNVSVDSTLVLHVATLERSPKIYEVSITARNDNLSYCLVPIPNGGIPVISAIEFQSLLTAPSRSSSIFRKLMQIDDVKGSSSYRYLEKSLRLSDNTTFGQDVPNKPFLSNAWVGCFVVGSILLLLLVVFITLLCCFYKRQKRLLTLEADRVSKLPPKYVVKMVLEPEVVELKSIEVRQFSLMELDAATNSFSNRIGEGGFGAVYHGILPEGQAVAVKVRSANSIQGLREFSNELTLLSGIRHENLVPLSGFCPEQQILVYPYMSNGSLQDRLYGEAARRKPLDWTTRLNIVLGAARGLHFLHTAGVRCIIHRDVKSSNILMDDSMVAKVADFGFSKYAPQEGDSMVSLEVRGTAGYLDPEYYSTQQLTVKSDVFSFGVVLLEIICGREPLNIHRPRPEWSLVEWAKPYIQESNIQAIVDPAISSSYTPEAMWRVVEIALTSVEPLGVHRPTMADIIRELEDALIIENNASMYMASIESLGSFRLSLSDAKMPPPMPLFYQFDPSPVFSETMALPDPR